MQVLVIEILVPLFNCVQNLAAFVSKFTSLQTEAILVKHFSFGFLCVFDSVVVYECMWSVFSVGLSLLHPNCSNFAVPGKHRFHYRLVRQF